MIDDLADQPAPDSPVGVITRLGDLFQIDDTFVGNIVLRVAFSIFEKGKVVDRLRKGLAKERDLKDLESMIERLTLSERLVLKRFIDSLADRPASNESAFLQLIDRAPRGALCRALNQRPTMRRGPGRKIQRSD